MLSVVFGKTSPVYEPGENISGDVVICVTSEYRILDLTVNYVGLSSVGFVVSEGKSRSLTCNKVEETDTHLDVLHPLVKSYRGVEIGPGVHTYSFAYSLPELLPSSYNSPYGKISYYLQVHLQTSAATHDLRSHFFVKASVNINLFKSSQCPQNAEVKEKYGIFGTKIFRLKTSLSKTGFVPGDVISVLVDAENGTSRHLRYLFCTLKQITQVLVKLEDQTENRVTKQNLVTVCHKVTGNQARYSWHCQFHSPTFLTPTISASTIVFVTYAIQVSAKLTGVTIPPQVQIPVIFGTRATISLNDSTSGTNNVIMHRSSLQGGIFDNTVQRSQSNPTVTNPRRRVTICSQPKYNLLYSDLGSQSTGSNFQQLDKEPLDALMEEDSLCNIETVRNSQTNSSTLNRRRRFTICTQPKRHSLFSTQRAASQDDRLDIYNLMQPNCMSDICFDTDSSVDISLVSDLRHRVSVSDQTDSSFPYSVLENLQQDKTTTKLQEAKISFKADYNCVVSQNTKPTFSHLKQPTSSKINFSNSTKKVGSQLQTIASQVTQHLSNQWQSNFPNQFRRFDCEHM